ncbi:MAG: regulatory signaling modulator protein AmpE [Ectothiorhodospira sp.]
MSFITIVLALLLERFTSRVEQLRSFIWLPRYAQAVRARAEGFGLGGTAALVVTIALPLVAVGLIFTLLGGVWGGVPGFVLSLAVLLFCLGPRNLDREVDAFLEAGALKDTEREARHAAQVLGDRPVPDGPVERARAVLEALLSESNGRVFAVLFWFVVLGPLGAVLYRMAHLLRVPAGEDGGEDAFQQAATRLQALLDWIPARLVALGYALTGSFDRAFPVLRANLKGPLAEMAAQNERLLQEAGSEAIQLPEADLSDPLQARATVERASNLVFRTLVAFVAVLALLTIAGITG